MSIAKWADYSGGRPSGAELRAAGFTGVIRYVGLGGSTKRITAGEYRDLVASGVQVLLVCELDTHDAEGGYTAGRANAAAALADARALGIPDSVGIAAACDEHLAAAQVPAAVEYVRGFRDVLGVGRTGAYGFSEFVDSVHDKGYASWWWKCGSAPTAAEAPWITFWQRNSGQTTQTVNLVVLDIDDEDNPIAGENDMQLSDPVTYEAPVYKDGQQATGKTTVGGVLGRIDPAFDQILTLGHQILAAVQGADDDVRASDAHQGAGFAAVQSAITAEQSALLGALAKVPAATVTVDPASLVAAGLPQDIANALLAVLNKAATTS